MTMPGEAPGRATGKGTLGAIILAGLCVAAIGGWLVYERISRQGKEAYVPAPVAPAEFQPRAASVPVHVRFTDVTESAGIRFRHTSGATGKKLLPETMGGACAFIDFDRDGDQDLLFVNSCQWPGDPADSPATQALYENDGKGGYSDVTAAKGLAVSFYGMGAAIGDFDGDGWDDVLFTSVGGERLFRNVEGKRFEEVTRQAGIPEEGRNTWSTSAAFLDYDNDGRLDIFVCRYVEWSPEIDLTLGFQITGIGRAYGPPQQFAGAFPKLYRNAGGGRFEDASAKAGVQVNNVLTQKPMAKALAVSVQDFDSDGYPDIAVANDTVQNFLFHNKKDGTFDEVGDDFGFAFDAAGNTRGAMGIDCARIDARGTMAIVVGNFANEITALYKSDKPLLLPFSDDAIAEGIGNPSRKYMKFGVFFFDLDLDGRLDIFEANGHLEGEIETVQAEQTYEQPAQIFWNCGPGAERGFEALGPAQLGPDIFTPVVGRGCAYGDVDGDGDLDVVLVANGGRARLFRNDGGDRNGWIRLKLTGAAPNTNAFGARVEIATGGGALRAELTSGRSYMSQCEQVITFGLGGAPEATSVRVWWPGKTEPQEIGSVPARTFREVKQP